MQSNLIDTVHDILTDLVYCAMWCRTPEEEPKVGDWCCEMSSAGHQNRDVKIGKLLWIGAEGEYITLTVGGQEVHWVNATMQKIPNTDKFLREPYKSGWPKRAGERQFGV